MSKEQKYPNKLVSKIYVRERMLVLSSLTLKSSQSNKEHNINITVNLET